MAGEAVLSELNLICEVKQVKTKKSGLDITYQITFETDDSSALALGVLPADRLVNVQIVETDG